MELDYKIGIVQKSFLKYQKGDRVKYIDKDTEDIVIVENDPLYNDVEKIAIEKGVITEMPKVLISLRK